MNVEEGPADIHDFIHACCMNLETFCDSFNSAIVVNYKSFLAAMKLHREAFPRGSHVAGYTTCASCENGPVFDIPVSDKEALRSWISNAYLDLPDAQSGLKVKALAMRWKLLLPSIPKEHEMVAGTVFRFVPSPVRMTDVRQVRKNDHQDLGAALSRLHQAVDADANSQGARDGGWHARCLRWTRRRRSSQRVRNSPRLTPTPTRRWMR
jgi:hypothetical protein